MEEVTAFLEQMEYLTPWAFKFLSCNKHTDTNQSLRNIKDHLSSLCSHIEAKWWLSAVESSQNVMF